MHSKGKKTSRSTKQAKILKMPSRKKPAARKVAKRKTSTPAKQNVKVSSLKDRRLALSRNKSLSRVTAMFFGFVLVYILRGLFAFAFTPQIEIERIVPGSITSPVELTGVIIRDEKVYRSPESGSVRFNVTENQRISRGTVVCSIQDSDEVARISEELIEVNEELLSVQAMRTNFTEMSSSERKINDLIKNMLDNWVADMNNNDFSSIYTIKDSLIANVDLRNQIILSESSEALRVQLNKRQMYQEELNRHMTLIMAEESGIVSTLLDGYEEVFTPSVRAMLPREQIVFDYDPRKTRTVTFAEEDTPLFKVVRSNTWYIAAYIPNDIIEGWEENDQKIIQDSNFNLPVTVERIVHEDYESYVLFRSTRYLEDYISRRSINFRVSGDINEGLKIPQLAVTTKTLTAVPREFVSIEDDQMKRAALIRADGETIRLHYIAIDEEMVYMEPDFVMGMEFQNPSDEHQRILLTETIEIMGVFRVNNGVADFRRIVINDGLQTYGFYVLDPALNRGLQERDSIVSNAETVTEGELIF